MVIKVAVDQMPSLPQVLIEILDAIGSDRADFQSIAKVIRHESAVTAKLISAANSSYFGSTKHCDSIERALLFLGTDAVKTIVITTSIKQFFGNFNQDHAQFLKTFWRRSLISANVAKVLATLTGYSNPDEAYLCGLLMDVGQLMLLTSEEKSYLSIIGSSNSDNELVTEEERLFGITHCELAGELIESWNIPGFMADACRYHQEPVDSILDTHHLVKIINLTSLLSAETDIDDHALEVADTLFGLNEALTRELLTRIGNDADNMASALGININNDSDQSEANKKLGEKVGAIAELAQISSDLWQVNSHEGLQKAIDRALFLTFGITDNMLFIYDTEHNILTARASSEQDEEKPTFTVPAESGRSIVSDTQLSGKSIISADLDGSLKIIDRQLLRYLNANSLVSWPLKSKQDSATIVGVLVLGANPDHAKLLQDKAQLISALCCEIAEAIRKNIERIESVEVENSDSVDYQLQINEAVHEASNPLSIIRNYLELLSIKLGDEDGASKELTIIKEEIDRVGNILLRLRDPEQTDGATGPVDINSIVTSIAQIFRASICTTKNIDLELKLDKTLTDTQANPEHLKQILTNLLKNAVEALPVKGKITISSEASVSFSGRHFVGIYIEDNGPGIDEKIKKNLFSPVTSTKGDGHSGLGLSIVKKLIDEMSGSIVCRSSAPNGTQFQILLPKLN
ncbi:MAG: HD-like signal output (HDOD) protein/signal transduction histidine kinase [Gammaproteobacteria bacterium]